MITYVDTSALLKLLIDEDGTDRTRLIWHGAEQPVSSTLLLVEARAALAAAARGRRLSAGQHRTTKAELQALAGDLTVIDVTNAVVALAADLAEEEALRGHDAVHLATALTARATLFASADSALCEAAGRRGLHVADPLDA